MSDENPVVPPKVRPTIKLRPVGSASAPAAAAPTATTAGEKASVATQPTIRLKPTIKLRTVGSTPAPAPTPVEPKPDSATELKKSQTSRIPLPEELTDAPQMKPLSSATQQVSTDAFAEPTPEQVQAAKSKTARIALDSVIGGITAEAPMGGTTQKTIRIKRATPPQSTVISSSAPIASATTGGSETSKPTIKLKRPTIVTKRTAEAATDDDGMQALDDLTALEPLTATPVVPAQNNKAFSIIAIIASVAAILVVVALLCCLGAQAGVPDSTPTGNTVGSLPFAPLPWIN